MTSIWKCERCGSVHVPNLRLCPDCWYTVLSPLPSGTPRPPAEEATADGAEHSTSFEVVAAVAEREGVHPDDIREPLHEVVDPDALDALFAPTYSGRDRDSGRVTIEYCGYRVTVEGDGVVSVTDPS